MKVLLTGASGEIGTPLLATLVRAGHELFVLSRRATAPARTPGQWVQGDLADQATLARAVACEPDAVVHMAAVTHTAKPREYEAVNVAGTANLIGALDGVSVTQFIYLSTRAVGAAGGAYAASKARAEDVVSGSALPWTILRPAEVYGSGGDDPILSLARGLQKKSFVPVLGDGSYTLCPVHAQDVVAAVDGGL